MFSFAFAQVLIDFQENPKAAQEHTKNPMVMNKIQKLISAGIVQMRWTKQSKNPNYYHRRLERFVKIFKWSLECVYRFELLK